MPGLCNLEDFQPSLFRRLAQGNVAMMNMGSWFIPTLIEKIKTGEYGSEVANWGLVKYPHAEGVEPGSTLATITCLSIPTSAPHKDLAWGVCKVCLRL